MIDITHKVTTYRQAIALALVTVGKQETIDAILTKSVPKGDVFEMAKTAGLFAVKRTSDLIPDCHPIPIEFTQVTFKIEGLTIQIELEVATIYKTGVEVEAMHGASVVALTIYDMLKPIDKQIEISKIQLIEKKGGKSDFTKSGSMGLNAAVVVCSDSISKGKKEDKAGKAIMAKLTHFGVSVEHYSIIADEEVEIQKKVREFVDLKYNLIVFTGGTGLSKRDVTPEAIEPLLQRPIPGISEAIRSYGQMRTPYAFLSRSLAGLIQNSLVLALPGSTKGASESIDAVFPSILHIFDIIDGGNHEKKD